MKRVFLLMLIAIVSIALVACGGESEDNDKEAKADDSKKTEEKEDKDKEESKEDESSEGDVKENEMGKFTLVSEKKDINETIENGPMKLTITGIQSATLEPSEDFKEMFEGKDKLTMINVGMKAENTSDDTVSFYPDQATLTTNAGDQVEADLVLSEQVGGDFFGKTKKEGDVIFKVDTPAEEIKDIKLIIDGASDENLESLGDSIELPLSF
ncbi:hypothetical protein [Virgibacillus pantothenticus]|uniref:hypothetical protein n=1 Tax=Virgibacillus pantothenticus TaxID=1473 RepID=UPI00067E1A9A|nr:hypothetical protein [Virgibacillus pantothenticus]MED3737249.1 hypothetical protein [Virgibacillus pantothenticus]QTY16964.1 hypothetical protein KBP50_03315 [Virgibacillus pantothenticus]SIT11481.1 hypothetical protein SAMN05421787_11756 [Virgibacillus pantothenticus]